MTATAPKPRICSHGRVWLVGDQVCACCVNCDKLKALLERTREYYRHTCETSSICLACDVEITLGVTE